MQYFSRKTTLLVSLVGSLICSFIGFFVLLAGAFYRIFFRTAGPTLYFLMACLISLSIVPFKTELAILVFSMWLVVGLFSEIERRGKASFNSASLAVLVVSGLTTFALWIVLKNQNLDFLSATTKVFEFVTTQQNQKLPEGFPIEKIAVLIPSITVVFLGFILGFGLILEKRISRLINVKLDSVAGRIRLQNLYLSDYLIWILILSFAASFSPLGGKDLNTIGLNVFVVTAFMYWFQGLAVVEFFFKSFQLGPISRLLFYIFIVLQMPFILSAIGVIDFWLNFRKKMKKTKIRTTTQNEENL